MERHNSCINTKAVIDYIEERDPSLVEPLLRDLSPELAGIGDLKGFLSDPNNWVSTDVLIRLYERVKRLCNKEDVVFDIGFESVAKTRLGYIQRILLFAFRSYVRAIHSHARTLKRLQSLNDKFNRTKRVHLVELRKDGAVVRLEWFRHIPMTRDFCLMNQGIYTAVPVVWNEPPCELESRRCYFDGDEYCEYHIRWRTPPSLKRLLLRIVAPWKLASASIQELEQDKELLREKYAEVNRLNLQLRAQVDQLVSLQETGTAILSTLDIQEVMSLILKRLVHVSALDRAAIFLMDEEKEMLYLALAMGVEPWQMEQFKAYTVPLTKGGNIIARVARTGQAELVDDVVSSRVNKENPLIKEFQPKAFIALPLNVRGKVVGVLVGDQQKGGGRVISQEKDFLINFSNQIAIAIHNANLYRKLEESERQYRELVENAHDGIWVVDENGVINFANQRLATILGYEQILGRSVNHLVAPDKRRVLLNLLVQNVQGAVAQEELQMVRRDGERITAIVSSVPIMEGDRYRGSFAMVTDITDKKRMEAQLLHGQKMESIGTMAGGIAHDFNNLLTAILGYASLLKHQLQDQPKSLRSLQVIETSSLRAADLIRQLLAFSRGTKPEGFQFVYLNRIVRETSRLLESSLTTYVELELDLTSSLPPIEANATQVQQALLNLCLNARDAMPDGGKITICTALVDGTGEAGPAPEDMGGTSTQYVRVRVADTGFGIPKENLDKIFDPFFTTKEVGKGSGLGLAMVYGIVKNASGHVRVESEEGKGSVFELLFPVSGEDSHEQSVKEEMVTLGGQESILLVDDEELVRELGAEILRGCGYRVSLARDGEEAVEVYRSSGAEIDLVILDLIMPNLGGEETLLQLRDLDPGVKVLICTGYSSKESELDGLVSGQVPKVYKPFKPQELTASIRWVLDGESRAHGSSGST
jgi:PAS domain S-box-containing protein